MRYPMLSLLVCGALAAPLLAAPIPASTPAPFPWSVAATTADETCDDCGRNKICKAHKARDRAELKRLEDKLVDEDPEVRMSALRDVAELATYHENAPGKEAAEVLVAALEDDQLKVQREAFGLLASGQHPEVAVAGFMDRLGWFKANMWSLVGDMTGPKGKHGSAGDAMAVLDAAVRGAGELRDDRIVKALEGLLKAFPDEMRGEPLAMVTVRTLLELGSQSAVQTVIKQFGAQKDVSKMRQVHSALKTFAFRFDVDDGPDYSDNAQGAWIKWLRKNKKLVPKKLGKWKGPEPEEVDEEDEQD